MTGPAPQVFQLIQQQIFLPLWCESPSFSRLFLPPQDLLKRMPTEQEAQAKRVEVVTGWLERERERLLTPVRH